MATNPNDIYLSEEQKRQIAEWADQNGKPWQTALQTMLESFKCRKRRRRLA